MPRKRLSSVHILPRTISAPSREALVWLDRETDTIRSGPRHGGGITTGATRGATRRVPSRCRTGRRTGRRTRSSGRTSMAAGGRRPPRRTRRANPDRSLLTRPGRGVSDGRCLHDPHSTRIAKANLDGRRKAAWATKEAEPIGMTSRLHVRSVRRTVGCCGASRCTTQPTGSSFRRPRTSVRSTARIRILGAFVDRIAFRRESDRSPRTLAAPPAPPTSPGASPSMASRDVRETDRAQEGALSTAP